MPCPHCEGDAFAAVGTGMSNVKCKSICVLPGVDGFGSLPSIQSTDELSTWSTSWRPAVMVTWGVAGGVAPPPAGGFEGARAPTKFSHLTNMPGLVTGTVTGTVVLTFPVKSTPLLPTPPVVLVSCLGSH